MADSPGVSRSMDFQPYLDKGRQFVENLQNIVSKPIDIPIRVIGGDDAQKAIQALQPDMSPESAFSAFPPPNSGRILPQQPDLSLAPDPRRYHRGNAWDSPEDFPNAPPDGLAIRAHEGWDKIKSGGAYHTLQESGRFGRKWGTFLGGNEKDEQRDWADAAGTPEGKKFSESMEEVEKTGKKIATLLKEIGQGGPGAVKAAEELKKAQAALDELGKAGKAAADGLGGDMGARLNAELEPLVKKAGDGKIPGEDAPLKFDPKHALGLLNNPMGYLMNGGAVEMARGMGMGPAGLGLLGGAAAVGAVAYGAYKYTDYTADKGIQDGLRMQDDVKLSRRLGNNFDLRGSYWGSKRMRAKEGIDTTSAREALDSMGVGLDNFQGDLQAGARAGGYDPNPKRDKYVDLTRSIVNAAPGMGLTTGQLASHVGSAMDAGAIDRSQVAVEGYLARIAGGQERARDAGIETNQYLASIDRLSAAQVAATGRLTEGSHAHSVNLMDAMNATGDPALKGVQGEGFLRGLGNKPSSEGQAALVLRDIMSDDSRREQVFKKLFGDDTAKRYLRMDKGSQMTLAMNSPDIMQSERQRLVEPGGSLYNLPLNVQMGLMGGVNNPFQLEGWTHGLHKGDAMRDLMRRPEDGKSRYQDLGGPLGKDNQSGLTRKISKSVSEDERANMGTDEVVASNKENGNTLHDIVGVLDAILGVIKTGDSSAFWNPPSPKVPFFVPPAPGNRK